MAAPLGSANLDTDQIIPADFMKTVTREGLGRHLFSRLRMNEDGAPRAEFVLNQPAYAQANILITGDNFGCGSSREHAPWALMDYGFRCLIGKSFADIFLSNAMHNGLLPVTLPGPAIETLLAEARGGNHTFTVDLPTQTVTAPSGARHGFDIDPRRKEKLLRGLDAIGETLQHLAAIDAFERRRDGSAPWLTPPAKARGRQVRSRRRAAAR